MDPSGLLSHPARLAGTPLLRLQSDERLVELARAGHEPAFDAIVHRYRPALLRYCTRILGPERAEDAVQQALASAHTAMTSGDQRQLNLRPWLYRIAHNTALNFLRGAKRDEVELSDAEFAAAHTPEDQVAERERLESVLAAIAALPRPQRDALLLRELEGRSHEEIGRALGVSPGAARATLFRARAAVRTACSALTPTPLLLRLVEVGDSSSHVAAKAVAGVLAGCAIVGGGAATTGVIGGTHHPTRPAQTEASASKGEVKAARTTPAPASSVATSAAAPVGPANGAPAAPARAAALRAVAKPKPVKVPKPEPKQKPKPQMHRAPDAVRPAPAGAAAAAAVRAERRAGRSDHAAPGARSGERPPVAGRHGRGPGDDVPRDQGRGRGHENADVAPSGSAVPAPASESTSTSTSSSASAAAGKAHGQHQGAGHDKGRGRDDDVSDDGSARRGPGQSENARGHGPRE